MRIMKTPGPGTAKRRERRAPTAGLLRSRDLHMLLLPRFKIAVGCFMNFAVAIGKRIVVRPSAIRCLPRLTPANHDGVRRICDGGNGTLIDNLQLARVPASVNIGI